MSPEGRRLWFRFSGVGAVMGPRAVGAGVDNLLLDGDQSGNYLLEGDQSGVILLEGSY